MYRDTRLIVHTFLLNLIMNLVTGGSHSDKIVATTLYFRQNGNVQQPPRYSGPQRPGPASLQPPGVRSGQVNGAPPLGHAQFSRNWPPNPHNQMFDANHVKKVR